MYNFLQEAAGLDSRESMLWTAPEEQDETQIEACECRDVEEEENGDPYSYIWDTPIPEVILWLDDDTADNLESLAPYDINALSSYLTKMEEFLEIEFPFRTYNTPLDELPFLYWEINGNGSVTFFIDQGDLIDYLNEEC